MNEDERKNHCYLGDGTYKDYQYLIALNPHAYRCGYVAA